MKPSKNKLTTDQLKIACRHVRELRAAGVTENLAIRSLEQFADFYAKAHSGGSVTPHHVRQVHRRQWSMLHERNSNGTLLQSCGWNMERLAEPLPRRSWSYSTTII
jgi:hypothetical protein